MCSYLVKGCDGSRVGVFLPTIYSHYLILYYSFVLEDPVMGCNISTVFLICPKLSSHLNELEIASR